MLEGGGGGRPTFGKFSQGHLETMEQGPDFVLGSSGEWAHGFHMWGDCAKGPSLRHLPPHSHLNQVRGGRR